MSLQDLGGRDSSTPDKLSQFGRGLLTQLSHSFEIASYSAAKTQIRAALRLRRLMCGKALPFPRPFAPAASLFRAAASKTKQEPERQSLSAHQAAEPHKPFMIPVLLFRNFSL
jgi:hypothetical protein